MRSLWVAVVVLAGAAAGCDRVFGLQSHSVTDATTVDAVLEGTTHDEDGDGILDADAKCPGISGGQQDSDGDGIGDACDPDPSLKANFMRRRWFAR